MGYQDKYADSIESQFCDLENRIIADIVRRIRKTGEITSTADWQVNKLWELGYSTAEIETAVKRTLKATYPEMFELYDKVGMWEYVLLGVLFMGSGLLILIVSLPCWLFSCVLGLVMIVVGFLLWRLG